MPEQVRFTWIDWQDGEVPGADLHAMMEFCNARTPGAWRLLIHNAAGRSAGTPLHTIAGRAQAEVAFIFHHSGAAAEFRARFFPPAPGGRA